MYYSDTITDPTHYVSKGFGQYEGYGDGTLPQLNFQNLAEAAVAAFILETAGASNQANKSIVTELEKAVDPEVLLSEDVIRPAHIEGVMATMVRRTIGEAALGEIPGLPKTIITAAQHMHFGPEALEIGSTRPTAEVPKLLDQEQVQDDLSAAVVEIAEHNALSVIPSEESLGEYNWDEYLNRLLDDSAEMPAIVS